MYEVYFYQDKNGKESVKEYLLELEENKERSKENG